MEHAPRSLRPASAPEARDNRAAAILPDHRPTSAIQRDLAEAARRGPRLVAQRATLSQLFGPAARLPGSGLTPLQPKVGDAVIQLGNSSGRQASDEKEKEEGRGKPAEDANAKRRALSQARLVECRELLASLVPDVEGLPKTFVIAAAGSLARQEMTSASDVEVFYAIPEGCSEEEAAAVKRLYQTFVAALEGQLNLSVDKEQSGTVAYIKGREAKGNFGRDVAVLYAAGGGADLAVQVAALTEEEVKQTIAGVSATLNGAVKKGPIELKGVLYRPLHLFCRLLAHAFGIPSANSIDIIDQVGALVGKRALLNDLKAVLIAVLDLREAAAKGSVELPKKLLKQILKNLFPALLRALAAYAKTEDRASLLQG